MSNHVLDQHFRDQLHGQSATVPAGMWEAVRQNIPTRRRRPVAWIILGGILLVSLGVLLLSRQTSTEKAAPAAHFVQESTKPEQPEARALPAVVDANEPADVDEVSNDVSVQAVAENTSAKPTSTDKLIETYPRATFRNPETLVASTTETSTNAITAVTTTDIETKGSVSEPPARSRALFEIEPFKTVLVLTDYDKKQEIAATDCYSFGKNGIGSILLDLYTGPSFGIKSMSSRDENVSDYITSRDTTEFGRAGFHVGVRAGYQHPLGFFARIGAQYTQLNERFDYINGSSTQIIITTDTIFDAGGNVIDIIPDTVVTSGTRVKKTYNRFHMVDIPILVGYQIENGDWAYGLQAGPMFNIAFSAKGDILAPNGVPGSFSDDQSNDYHPVFKDQLGISVYGSAYAQKRIGERLFAFVEPHVLHRINSISLDSYPIDQRQTTVGLSLGVRMRL